MIRYQILGQSNYAVAILLDTLRSLHDEPITVDIVSNIAPEENPTLAYPYTVAGVTTREIRHEDWRQPAKGRLLIGSIGRSRQRIFEFFRDRHGVAPTDFANTVHPRANLAYEVRIGRGVHVGPSVTIAPHASLGDFVVVNRNASVGHHTVVEDFVTINPGAHVAGVCSLRRGATVGAGATVIDRKTIGEDSVIGAGSVVTGDIPPGVVAYGVPARVVRSRS